MRALRVVSVRSILPLCLGLVGLSPAIARADGTYFSLASGNFSQSWSDASLITTNDVWTGVPSIIGYRGDDITTGTGVDPQTVLAEGTFVVDVNANQMTPATSTVGGVSEFAITNPVVALQPSGTADAPNLVIHLDTTGRSDVTVAYVLRDIDDSTDNAPQAVALQYRVGSTGDFINLPAGFVADATEGPSLAALTTAVSVVLPMAAWNQPRVEVRILTSNQAGADEWVGIDDLSVTSTGVVPCGNGTLDAGETCDSGALNGTTPCGCTTSCTFPSFLTVCGAATSVCDAPDLCDGAGTCLAFFAPSTTTCRPSADVCDVAETCTGTSATCPADGFAAAGTVCAPSSGATCDAPDVCDGASAACSPRFAASSVVCRAVNGDCDVAESCTGTSTVCPADGFRAAGALCRSGAGLCDVAEVCSGASNACPTDGFASVGTICRPQSGVCDVAETCVGTASCPIDGSAPNGTSCDDGLGCNGTSTCNAGACSAGTPVACTDGNRCTTDACVEPGTCSFSTIAGCCLTNADCDDGDGCTVDACGVAGTCSHTALSCDDGDACTADACSAGACMNAPICDAGMPDAGSDAGAPESDAGVPESDAGESDAGVPEIDAGEIDAGAFDAGSATLDAGELDAGSMMMLDATIGTDAGPRDASVDGARADAAADASVTPPLPTGCACRASTSQRGAPAAVLALLLGLALMGRRRSR